jgi:hypothetical protein
MTYYASNEPLSLRIVEEGIMSGEPTDQDIQALAHVTRSLLIRLKLASHTDEAVEVLCGCERVGGTGLRLMLPCQMNLHPGNPVKLDLFLSGSEDPVAASGMVRRATLLSTDDAVRYVLDIDFTHPSSLLEKSVAAFVHEFRADEHTSLFA